MRARFRSAALAGTLLVATLASRGAGAYVRGVSMADPPQPLYWSSSCETVTIYLNGFTQMTPDEVAKSIGAAAAAWGPDQVTCPGAGRHPYFEIISQLVTGGTAPAPAPDGKNTVVFQTTSWDETPDALAYAKVWKDPGGHIIDVDIEINAVSGTMPYLLANLDPGVPPEQHDQARIDLQTLMTHEFGHFIGLAHTCQNPPGEGDDGDQPTGPYATDDQGQPIPTCMQYPDSSEATQAAAVMWYQIDPESITKRVLSADEVRGVCSIYSPETLNVPVCTQNSPDDGCGCATEGTHDGRLTGIALALALIVAARRRRSRARC